MTRPSHRDRILTAALHVVAEGGVSALTIDAIARAAGVTKGGVLYHFASREGLLQAVHEFLADRWNALLVDAADVAPEVASADQRLEAYVRVNELAVTREDLALMLDAAGKPEQRAPSSAVIGVWAPPPPADSSDPAAMTRFIVRLASDGLWLYGALGQDAIPDTMRAEITAHLLRLLADGERPADDAPDDRADHRGHHI